MYSGFFENLLDDGDAAVGLSVLGVMVVYMAIISLISLVFYILRAIGVYNMAKTAQINNPWLAFVPFANVFTYGKIAEKYKRKDGKKSAKFGVLMLVFNIVTFVVGMAILALAIILFARVIFVQTLDEGTATRLEIIPAIIPIVFMYLILMASTFTAIALRYVALWRIFAAYDYNNATLYTVLSIFFGFLDSIFLFIIRNNQPEFDPNERMRKQLEMYNIQN